MAARWGRVTEAVTVAWAVLATFIYQKLTNASP